MINNFAGSTRKRVWSRFAEHVTHVGTGHDFQCTSAHPDAETKFQILSAPYVHPFIIFSQQLEVVTIDGKEATSHSGSPDRKTAIAFSSFHFSLRNTIPSEIQFPIESSPRHVRCRHVFKICITDHVNDGTDDTSPVLDYSCQQWFQPAVCTLAVGVQERDDLSCTFSSSDQSGANQS